jgi:hypothetical protein
LTRNSEKNKFFTGSGILQMNSLTKLISFIDAKIKHKNNSAIYEKFLTIFASVIAEARLVL